jgi:hypothetical protein
VAAGPSTGGLWQHRTMTVGNRPPRGPDGPAGWQSEFGAGACPGCGYANDPGARLCRVCGLPVSGAPADPVRGVSTRPLDLPAERGASLGAALGLLLVVLVLGGAGALAVGGDQILGSGGQLALTEPSPSPTAVAASPRPVAPGSPDPGAASPSPVAPATPPPDGSMISGTRTAWRCDPASIVDPTMGSWRVTRFLWGERNNRDEITFQLERQGDGEDDPATIGFEWMPPAQAAERFGVERPTGGRALVVTFDGPVVINSDNAVDAGLLRARSIDVRMGEDEVLRAIVGVRGQGCARLVAPEWGRPGDDPTARILLSIQHGE